MWNKRFKKNPNVEEARNLKTALSNCLDRLDSGGAFATTGVHTEAPLPDLSLPGFGPIPLPLAERDASAISEERTESKDANVRGLCSRNDWLTSNYVGSVSLVETRREIRRQGVWKEFSESVGNEE